MESGSILNGLRDQSLDTTLDFLKQPVDMGTSIMAVAYDGGVIVGADSRTSTGVYVSNRVSDYVTHYLNQHRMQYGQPPKVESAANVFNQLGYHNKNALTAGIIVAGWDKQKGGQVFAIPVGGGLLPRPFAIGGSGSTYIYGFCDAYYRPGMNQQQCE